MATTNESQNVNPKKEEKLQDNGPSMKDRAVNGTKAAIGTTGSLIQSAAKAGGVWIVGGFIAMASAQYLGLGLIGTFIALAAVYVAVEGLKFIFSEDYSLQRKSLKEKFNNTKDSVKNKLTRQEQAA